MNCQILAGPDSGGIKEALGEFRTQLAKKLGEEPDVHHCFVGQDTVVDMLAQARTSSLFAAFQLIVVHGCDGLAAADLKLIKQYWEKPNDQTAIVFLADETRTIADKFGFAPKAAARTFYELDEGAKKAEIRRYLADRQVQIDQEALDLVAELVSGDRADIRSQCDTLLTVHATKTKISVDEVEHFIFHSREESQYTLFEYLITRNLASALESLETILVSQTLEPVGLVLGLQWQFRSLLTLAERTGRQPSWDDFRALRITMKRSQALYTQALGRFTHERIQAMVASLARYDFLVREARPGTAKLQLECLVYEIIEGRVIPSPGTETLAVL